MENKREIIKNLARVAMRDLCLPFKLAKKQVKAILAQEEKEILRPVESMQQLVLRLRRLREIAFADCSVRRCAL